MIDFVGPGMTGPNVERLQALIGVPVTGVYDAVTELAVRGRQVLYNSPMRDGVWDSDLESQIVGASRLTRAE